ncbi:ribosomal protein S10 domain-containing protein [Lyophyllum atratum]|nr:ribosomal protein S10 domain-containing protein [Lyophyllum atratum]
MFRVVLARPPRAALPSVTRWRRCKTTGPVVPPPSATSPKPSTSKDANVVLPTPPTSKPVDIDLSALSLEDDPSYVDLERELSEILEEDLSAAFKEAPRVAETEAELFGMQPIIETPVRLALDPKNLPTPPLDPDAPFTEEQYAASLVHGRGIQFPIFHPRTHDIPVANIQFRSHHPRLLDLFTHFATHAASSLGIPVSRVVTLPTKRTLWTVPRSPFAHKKSQENFERRVHKRAIKAWDADPEVVDRWCKYLRRHALGGVGMRITKWERLPLGFGKSRLEGVMARLEKGDAVSGQKIKALGEKIVAEELATLAKAKVEAKIPLKN